MARFDLFHNKDDIQSYSSGDVIFNTGDAGECLYDVVSGKVSLVKEGKNLTVLGEGEIFGEVALINNANHSVTAIAETDCKLAQITKRRFLFMVDQTPKFAISVMQVLAERLSQETERK